MRSACNIVAAKGVITEGFRTMGLTGNGDSVLVNPAAIDDYKLLSCDRNEKEQQSDALIFDIEGDIVDLGNLNPRERRVTGAHRKFWMEQGMDLMKAKKFNYLNPDAVEMTTSPRQRIAEANDIKRDVNRTKKTRAQIIKMANVAGLAVDVEGQPNATPKPGDGFILVPGDEIVDVLTKVGMSKPGACLERFVELVADSIQYSVWVFFRSYWFRVADTEILKHYKGDTPKISEVQCKLQSEKEYEKRFGRVDLKVVTYGMGEAHCWVVYRKVIAPIAEPIAP
jgi:hypothetical protein